MRFGVYLGYCPCPLTVCTKVSTVMRLVLQARHDDRERLSSCSALLHGMTCSSDARPQVRCRSAVEISKLETCSAMSCARGFAELAAAVIRSGVDPEFLVQLEEDQVHSLCLARKRLQQGHLDADYKSSLLAVLAAEGIMLGDENDPPKKRLRKDLPTDQPSQ